MNKTLVSTRNCYCQECSINRTKHFKYQWIFSGRNFSYVFRLHNKCCKNSETTCRIL